MRQDIAAFADKIRAYAAGEVDAKAYKGFLSVKNTTQTTGVDR